MSTRTNFKGKSYTGWLNDGWEQYCTTSAVRYATIAGNNNPFDPWFATLMVPLIEILFFLLAQNSTLFQKHLI